jgi:ankyrin repeat protein
VREIADASVAYQGCNPLHLAVKQSSAAAGYAPLLDCLVRAAARHGELDRRNASGMTPLMVAASTANRLAVEKLLEWRAGDLQYIY